ncbi:hypothetical protein J7E88_29520 [Streptomyces sp. ISL-10]|uniref:hypothetical protein n=1 Tax=Streptomyces sp. ISL-10 TaxID=2819172 RepID=UPI001BEA3D2F|nr:hypothetical protein [Streptomyces sp. ISL-10]MBT2369329.1 hypothetical protein [Streptomyces sp. ISL-10]
MPATTTYAGTCPIASRPAAEAAGLDVVDVRQEALRTATTWRGLQRGLAKAGSGHSDAFEQRLGADRRGVAQG